MTSLFIFMCCISFACLIALKFGGLHRVHGGKWQKCLVPGFNGYVSDSPP